MAKNVLQGVADENGKRHGRGYAKYLPPNRQRPGFVGEHAHLVDRAEFRQQYVANLTPGIERDRERRLAIIGTQRERALADAARASDPAERARLREQAERTYDVQAKQIEAEAQVQRTYAGFSSTYASGFVDKDGELWVAADAKDIPGTAHHEAVHKLASPEWDRKIEASGPGHELDEAMTEYFTQEVGARDAAGSTALEPAYSEGPKILRQRYSDDALATAYFKGDFSKMNREHNVIDTRDELHKKFDQSLGRK